MYKLSLLIRNSKSLFSRTSKQLFRTNFFELNSNKNNLLLNHCRNYEETEQRTIQMDINKNIVQHENTLKDETISTEIEKRELIKKENEESLRLAQSFEDVPGPYIFKFLNNCWKIMPLVTNQMTAAATVYYMNMMGSNMMWYRGVEPYIQMFEKYGALIRIHGIFGGDIVLVSRPQHIEAVLSQEGKCPIRSSLDSIEKYRLEIRKCRSSGPFLMNGPEWEILRGKIEEPFKTCAEQFYSTLDKISIQFINRIVDIRNKQEEVPVDFENQIYKWSLESTGFVAFNKQLGCLNTNISMLSEGMELFDAMINATKALRKCERGIQFWRLYETPTWKELCTACDNIDNISYKYIRSAQVQIHNQKQLDLLGLPFIERLILKENVSSEDVMTIILDMLLIGVNATAHALAHILYNLSKAPKVQKEIYNEIIGVMPHRLDPSVGSIENLVYLPAVIKESLRLFPPIPIISRILNNDIVLHNYRIPKGTNVLMASHVSSRKEEYFEDAKKFNPSRWLDLDKDIIHPFASLPYGHGTRSCLGQHLAQTQLLLAVARIVRNFHLEYNYGDIIAQNYFMAMPKNKLKFRFIDREN